MNPIFDEVKRTLQERAHAYGDASEMHQLIAEYWGTYLDKDISASDVAVMMTLFKIARSSYGDSLETADDLKDAIGYMGFAAEFRGEEASEDLFDPSILGFDREDIENMPTLEEVFVTPSKEWQEKKEEQEDKGKHEEPSIFNSELLDNFYRRNRELAETLAEIGEQTKKFAGATMKIIDFDGKPHIDNGNGFVEIEEKYRKSNFEDHLDNVSEQNRGV